LTGMDMRVRTSVEQSWKAQIRASSRECLLEVRAQLDAVREAFAARSTFDARELDTGPLAIAERALATTLRDREAALRHSAGPDWYHAMTDDVQALTTTRVALFGHEERRLAAIDALGQESAGLATLRPAQFPEALPEAGQLAALSAAATPAEAVDPNRSLVAWVSAV